jgi:hypothetical protein
VFGRIGCGKKCGSECPSISFFWASDAAGAFAVSYFASSFLSASASLALAAFEASTLAGSTVTDGASSTGSAFGAAGAV